MESDIRLINVMDNQEALQVLSLQLSSYRVEAEVIGFTDLPPLKDNFATLRESGETFCGCYADEQLAGCTAYKRAGDTVEVCRMMVHPDYFRRGIAHALLTFVEEQEADAREFSVNAVVSNYPAVLLYEGLGYQAGEQWEIASGITMAKYTKFVY